MSEEEEFIEVIGARVHNLKDVSIKIPRNRLVVMTGVSGSGKSSLAFDTIYAEGQRRYLETFSAYARQFLGTMERPDVDKINGLSPVIAIEQKTISKNPRSTVGTITEIYDFFRLLYARVSNAYSYNTGELMVKFTTNQIVDLIIEQYQGRKILLLAPIIKGRKGHYKELFAQFMKQGFLKVRVDGELFEMHPKMQLDRYKIHDVEVVVDQLKVKNEDYQRILASVETTLKLGDDSLMVYEFQDKEDSNKIPRYRLLSKKLMCPTTGISYNEPEPNLFSFNSPYGACKKCSGLGQVSEIDIIKVIPNPKLSIKKGGIAPLGEYKNNWAFKQIEAIAANYEFTINTPLSEIEEEALDCLLYGSSEPINMKHEVDGQTKNYQLDFEGVINIVLRQLEEKSSPSLTRWANSFMNKIDCPDCGGSRLKKEALNFRIDNKNIGEIAIKDLRELSEWVARIDKDRKHFFAERHEIAEEILKEINKRLQFLLDVGLTYLTLNRASATLSGGEAQRIRLATQIGSQLVNVLYILDEPSIGLHQRDNHRLINSLKELRDVGNSIIVVEHDKDIMLASDYIIDIGPKAGKQGGNVVAAATPKEFIKQPANTAAFLNRQVTIDVPKKRRKGNGNYIELSGASGNNLKNVTFKLPLGMFVCVTGVSGSGKSTLVNETLYPIINQHVYKAVKKPLPYKKITGLEHIDKIIEISQTPIGRTPRSNPATYSNVFGDIRLLYSNLPEAKIRGYKPGRFSFNVKGGRCESCQGAGVRTIEMNFLPDVYVMCDECNGKRYNRETLEVRYKGKSISDVLNMSIERAVIFFENHPNILQKIKTLNDVGLGYINLGQPSTTLSGGEAQRVKLAAELAKRQTGKTLYILDEPSTGLHFEDIKVLLGVLNKLVDIGNSVLVVEHNLDIIKVADYIVDIGLEGGQAGGRIMAEGTPEQLAKSKKSYTANFLKEELNYKIN